MAELPRQEVRLAVVLTGGVSLAVWMGGVAREINLLTQVSRARRDGVQGPRRSGAENRLRDAYGELLDLLGVDVSIDVLSGTSAGGINAAVLGLANARGLDIGTLRELWDDSGSLATLLRDPREPKPPSILQGDGGLLRGLHAGLTALAAQPPHPPADDPTNVFVTTTLLKGQPNRLEDDYGTLIEDSDHHGVFSFDSAALASGGKDVIAALALAARCSASFPGAFEPAFVPIGFRLDDMHPDMQAYIPLYESRYCADGGLLANRPIGAALAAVFDRPAGDAVRRLLAYVVPSASSPGAAAEAAETFTAPPTLPGALVADLGSQISQTIATELEAIHAHNQRVDARRDLRLQLARFGMQAPLLDAGMYDLCRASLARDAARVVVDELVHRDPDLADVRGVLSDVTQAVKATISPALPDDAATAATMGRPAFDGAKATVLMLVRGAWVVDPERADTWKATVEAVHASTPSQRPLPVDVTAAVRGNPQASDRHSLAPADRVAAGTIANSLRGADADGLAQLTAAWTGLAQAVTDGAFLSALERAAGSGPDAPFAVLARYLGLIAVPGQPNQAVTPQLVQLFVAERTLSPQTPLLEQRIGFVQVSADTRTLLDPARDAAAKKLNGFQLHHFASFYKRSWRANDWMWGRLDGVGWLVHILLDPQRLREVADLSEPGWLEALPARLAALTQTAVGPTMAVPPSAPAKVTDELLALAQASKDDLPASLPETATWAAAALQRLVVADELVAVARAVEQDRKAGGAVTRQATSFRSEYYGVLGAAGQTGATADDDRPDLLTATARTEPLAPGEHPLDQLLTSCAISQETFEGERGSRLFTTVVTQAAAVAVSAVQGVGTVPPPVRPVAKAASWTTRTAYMAASRSTDRRGLNAAACLVGIAGGLGLMASNQPVLSTLGFGVALVGVFLLSLLARPGTPGKVFAALVTVLVLGFTAALAAAVWIQPVRDRLFPWLTGWLDDFQKGQQPWIWFAIVVFLLAPPVVMVVDGVLDLRRRMAERRRRQLQAQAASAPSAKVPEQRSEDARGPADAGTKVA
jgi:predicted acylesterase/phospholipase RssA